MLHRLEANCIAATKSHLPLAIGSFLCVFLCGCGNMEAATAALKGERDPAGEFEQTAKQFIPSYNEVYKSGDRGAMLRKASANPVSAKINVQRTSNSNIPYTGEIRVEGVLEIEHSGPCVGMFSFLFVYEDGRWVPKGGGFSGTTSRGIRVDGFEITSAAMARIMARAGS